MTILPSRFNREFELPVYITPKEKSHGDIRFAENREIKLFEKRDHRLLIVNTGGDKRVLTLFMESENPPQFCNFTHLPPADWKVSSSGTVVVVDYPDHFRFDAIICSWWNGKYAIRTVPLLEGEIFPETAPEYSPHPLVEFDNYSFVPGAEATIYYLDGDDKTAYLFASFEMSNVTSAIVSGCGLYDGESWIEGGSGFKINSNWIGDHRLCWEVEYGCNKYPVKPSDYTAYSGGDRVFVMRGGLSGVVKPEGEINTDNSFSLKKKGLSYEDDMIVPIYIKA